MTESKGSIFPDERVWYDQFTSTDWVHDSIADAYRVKALRSRKDFWGRVYVLFDASQGWILSAVAGFVVAVLAYVIDVSEQTIFDFKDGYCARAWYLSEKVGFALGEDTSTPSSDADILTRDAVQLALAQTGETGVRSCKVFLLGRGGQNSWSTGASSSSLRVSPACSH
jgi:hypothetical protein